MGAEGQPQGAIIGDNPDARAIYERLSNGSPAFSTSPTGAPPVGGTNIPTQDEIKTAALKPPLGGLKGLVEEVRELRREIQELKSLLSTL